MLSGFMKRLLMARQAQFVEGDVKLFNRPYFLNPVEHHVILFAKLEKTYGEKGTAILYDSGKDASKAMVAYFMQKFSMGPGEELLNLWKNVFESSGLGELEIVALKPKEGRAVMRLKTSPFAKQYLEAAGRRKTPVDYHIAGMIAGLIESMSKKKNLSCEETKCIVAGAPFCEFVCSG